MKTYPLALLLIFSSLSSVHALEGVVRELPPGRSLRAGAVHDTKATPSEGSMTGFEIAYAQDMYPMDQMGVKYTYLSSSAVEHNSFLLFFEDRYALTEILSIYGTSGIGYMLTDRSDAENREGLIGVLGLGLLLDLEGPWSVYTSAEYSFGSQHFWVDGDDEAKRNLQVSLGLRWTF